MPTLDTDKLAYSPRELVAIISESYESILRMIKSGELPAKTKNGRYKILAADLREWLAGLEDA